MPDRIPASELYQIREEDIRNAITEPRVGSLPPTFKDSTRFDLLADGNKRLPPKATIAFAALRPLGRVLSSSEIRGGESSPVFRLRLERGFEFATKMMWVAELEATFSVGRDKDTEFFIVETRSEDRNRNYHDGLEALLGELADLDASIEEILIDSKATRSSPIDQRRLKSRTWPYLFRLQAIGNLAALRREIAGAAAVTGRSPYATGAWNPTKRLRRVFAEPEDLELSTIGSLLAQYRGKSLPRSKQFMFLARPPAPCGDRVGSRRAIDETGVAHIHDEMNQSLYNHLIAVHGPGRVSCEAVTCSGRPADIIASLPNGHELFEIKTLLAPRDCVREAFGQLLEYAYWPGSPEFNALWIVGPSPIDSATQEHLDGLRVRLRIPVRDRHQPVAAPSP